MGGVVRSGGCEAEVGALDVAGPFPPPPGFYNSAAGPGQGYIRKADGSFVVFNVPNSKGTFPVGIAANGAVVTIAIPGAAGATAWAVNRVGELAGVFTVGGANHSFFRSAGGVAITTDIVGADYTQAAGLNGAGKITGSYNDGAVMSTRSY